MKKNILTVGLFLVVIGGLNIDVLAPAETNSGAIATAQDSAEGKGKAAPTLDARERKIPRSDATTSWGYYGVTPESPDEKRLCYALYPEPIDLNRDEKYPVYPAELWVCDRDGDGHRKLFEGNGSVHNGLRQSWVDDKRIVFASGNSTYIVNADTGRVEFGPFEEFAPGHYALGGKVLISPSTDSAKQNGLYEFDTATNKMRLVAPFNNRISHAQYSPDGKKVLFKTTGVDTSSVDTLPALAAVDLESGDIKVYPGKKPMHFQWFDSRSLFGYVQTGVMGVDTDKHHNHELYRWNLDGEIVERLAGLGCHGAARADGEYFVGESWYFSSPIVLRLYRRGQSKPMADIFSHRFAHVTWENGGRHHVNPSFSRDGMRLYYKRAVNENTSQAFSYDLTGLVSPLRMTGRGEW